MPNSMLSKRLFIYSSIAIIFCSNTLYAKSKVSPSTMMFNFSNADIESVVKTVAQATGKTILLDPRVRGNISFNSEKPVTSNQAVSVLASILRMQGFSIVEENGYMRVVPESDAKSLGSRVITSKNRITSTGQISTQIFNIKYESANTLLAMLRNIVSPANMNTIAASPNSNSLIVTDYDDNLRRISKIIASLDMPKNRGFEVISLEHAMASDIGAIAGKMFDSNNNDIAFKVNLMVDNRTNTIIISSNNPERVSQMKSLILRLDTPTTMAGNIWVVPLKNADANSVAQTLRAVLSGTASTPSVSTNNNSVSTNSNSSTTANNNPANSLLSNEAQNVNFTASQSNSLGGQVQADVATNSVIITASEIQYKNLRNVIEQLDIKRAQVFVESMIVEISSQKAAELGVQWQALLGGGANRFYVGNGINGSGNIAQVGSAASSILTLGNGASAGDLQTLAPAASGFNLAWLHQFGKTFGLAALAKALNNQTGVNILSTPNLLTLDNEEAKIIIGQNVPFVTGQYTNGNNAGNSSVNPFQTIERNDVGLTLRVKPQVSSNNKVKLKIYQEVSSVDDKSNVSGIITNKRSIDTTVEVNNGEAIVLGGLLEDNYSDGIEKIPMLGDLPLIGGLFRYERKSRGKKNLMLFLRPYVVFDNAKEVTASRYDYMHQQQINYKPNTKILNEDGYPMLELYPQQPLQNNKIQSLDSTLDSYRK